MKDRSETQKLTLTGTEREYVSGQQAPPGVYIDTTTGAKVTLRMEDELPEGMKLMRFERRYRRMEQSDTTVLTNEEPMALPRAA